MVNICVLPSTFPFDLLLTRGWCLDVVGTHRFGKPCELEALVPYRI